MYFRARLRCINKFEKTFWMAKNLKISPKDDFFKKGQFYNQLHQNFYCDLKIYFYDSNRALKYMNSMLFGKIKFS